MYCSIEDITMQVAESILARAAGKSDGTLDEMRINGLIQSASDEMDSYCRSLYKTPFTHPSPRIKGLCVDIAIYNIYSGIGFNFASDSKDRIIYERYKSAIEFLKLVMAGKVELEEGKISGNNDDPNSFGTRNLRISSEKRRFGRSRMRDF